MTLHLQTLSLSDFRNYRTVTLDLPPGITAVVGGNGQGKTNLLEAVAHLAGVSLRGATSDTMVRAGAPSAIVRSDATRNNRALLLEAEIQVRGRNRMQLNRQPVRRQRDLAEAILVTVFAPDDLALVKAGPGERRRWLDDALVALDPRLDGLRSELDRILRQRNALLKQARGRLDEAASVTLEIWDERLCRAGEDLAAARDRALTLLTPRISQAYVDLAGVPTDVTVQYHPAWREQGLGAALTAARPDDLRRSMTTVGPHRDDVEFRIGGLPARTQASQGEQRSLALAMRLATHRTIDEVLGVRPILLLDDVLSELDDQRAAALLEHLPEGQTLLTTAARLPDRPHPDLLLRIVEGTIAPAP